MLRRSKFKWKDLYVPTPEQERLAERCQECQMKGAFKVLFIGLFAFFWYIVLGGTI